MKELTSRQKEYLLFFSTLQGNKKCISDASNQFKVSKPTVFNIVETLEELGFVIKGNGGEITFTQFGLDYINPKIEICKILEKWLESDLGLTPITSEFEARKLIVTLEEETITALVKSIFDNAQNKNYNVNKNHFKHLENGEYEIPFSVYKIDKKDISMGDRGFIKPAVLQKTDNTSILFLYAHNLKYVSKKRNRLQGSLYRLWYTSNNKWYEAEMLENGCYIISEEALIFNEEKTVCELKIRARATVSNLKMPESEAVIIFNLNEIKERTNI